MRKEQVQDGANYVVENNVHQLSVGGPRAKIPAGTYQGIILHDTLQIGAAKFDLRVLKLKPKYGKAVYFLDLGASYANFVLAAVRFESEAPSPSPSPGPEDGGAQAVEQNRVG